jgi:hypothetical protein
MWIAAHERAIEEAMETDPDLSWEDAYNSDAVAKRADLLCAERWADGPAPLDGSADDIDSEGTKT